MKEGPGPEPFMKRLVRSLVVRAPGLRDAKAAMKSRLLKAAGRPFEPEFRILAHLAAAPGEVALDVGANRGQSIDAIRLYQPALALHAFEPDANLAAQLERRFTDDPGIVIERCGLGAAAGGFTLFTPFYGDYEFDGLASTNREEALSWLSPKTLLGFDPAKLTIREQAIAVKPLDAFGLSPAFIKIDVQGGEAAVLQGGRETIERCRPVLLIETGTNEPLVEAVRALGYDAFNFLAGALHPDVAPGI